jgi:CubicO group peptidase (beta-lactamase class C family)
VATQLYAGHCQGEDCLGGVKAGVVTGDLLSALGCLFLVVTAGGWVRMFARRVPRACGDPELAVELDRVTGRRTRCVAAAVVDPRTGTRMAFIGGDVDASTRFEVGSVTKAMTGMLLAEAVRRGEVTLASTVGDLLGDTAGSPLGSVTLRELCTHTSGLPRQSRSPGTLVRAAGSAWFGVDPYRGLSATAVLRLAQRQRLTGRGTQRYSNLGASVLGHALAAAAGQDFPTLLAERVCTPTGMDATLIATRADTAPRGWTALGRRPQPWVLGGYSPAGGAVSTLADTTRLAVSLLDGSAPGLACLEPIGRFAPDRPERATGMFWVIDTVPGTDRAMVWHNGQTGGYSAFLALYPQARRAVVVLSNVARATEPQRIAVALTRWLIDTNQPRNGRASP